MSQFISRKEFFSIYYIINVYKLSITGLTTQRDMQTLIKVLLKVPGLTADNISRGLKIPPFEVLTVEQESQAEKVKASLEKLGAVCEIENTDAIPKQMGEKPHSIAHHQLKKPEKKKSPLTFWLVITAILLFFAALTLVFQDADKTKATTRKVAPKAAPAAVPAATARAPATPPPQNSPAKYAKTSTPDLKQTLHKNPYDTDAWKKLAENLEKEGDSASAKTARQSYDQAVKAQRILSSLASRFGNGTRVEVKEDAVYYRTSKDLSDREFYYEAAMLRDSLSAKFPNKDLVVENYTSDNKTQSVRLPAGYKSSYVDAPISED